MKLCTGCHKPLNWKVYFTDHGRYFCARHCQIQFGKLSQEEQKAAHYEWVRQEALVNSQSDWVS